MYYVSMTDKFMSGWGRAEGKINRLIFVCDTLGEAGIVADNTRARPEMARVNVSGDMPRYSARTHLALVKTRAACSNCYIAGFFAS